MNWTARAEGTEWQPREVLEQARTKGDLIWLLQCNHEDVRDRAVEKVKAGYYIYVSPRGDYTYHIRKEG